MPRPKAAVKVGDYVQFETSGAGLTTTRTGRVVRIQTPREKGRGMVRRAVVKVDGWEYKPALVACRRVAKSAAKEESK